MNHLARLVRSGGFVDSSLLQIILLATRVLQLANEDIMTAFNHSFAAVDLLPRSRVANLATASLSPMLATLCEKPEIQLEVKKSVDVSAQAAVTSILRLPELAAQSALGCHAYDIRGTMRGPGGEDHVGCLSLMRLVFESDDLARLLVAASPQITERLCHVHAELKSIEVERGQSVMHGRGVTPKSRRILLNVICRLEHLSGGKAGASGIIHNLFRSAVGTVLSCGATSPLNEQQYYELSEAVSDLASLSPVIVRSLFESDSIEDLSCLEVLTNSCLKGYDWIKKKENPDRLLMQWNRLRAATFSLLKLSAYPYMAPRVAEIIRVLIRAECEAIHYQCLCGPNSGSSLFHEDVVSPDCVPAGLFVQVITCALEKCHLARSLEDLQQCLTTLHESRSFVLPSLLLSCSDPLTGAFVDPRPTLAETWFFSMVHTARLASMGTSSVTIDDLLTDTMSVVFMLLLYPILGKTVEERASAPGFNFDGPQSLALTDLLAVFFRLGPSLLERVSGRILEQVPVDFGSAQDSSLQGVGIIGAALFRASQGGLPPWAIESLPDIYSGLYIALNRDCDRFAQVLHLSMHTRLSLTAAQGVGSVRPGELISGPHFETLSEDAKRKFELEARDCSSNDNTASWRRLKVLIKQVCGGKKKETDFGQKPSLTTWEFDRL